MLSLSQTRLPGLFLLSSNHLDHPFPEPAQNLLKSNKKNTISIHLGRQYMVSLSFCRRERLPQRLVRLHDALLNTSIKYFESERDCRKGIRKGRKSLKKALKLARKKKINPGLSIRGAREVLVSLRDEIQMSRKALLVTSTSLGIALNQIQQERIDQPLALIDDACELFRNKEIEKGLILLRQSQTEFEKKVLVKTRTALFGGTSNAVKEIKEEIGVWMAEKREGGHQHRNHKEKPVSSPR